MSILDATRASDVGSRGRLSFAALAVLWVVAAGVSGCAEFTVNDALEQDVAKLRQDVNKLTLAVHRERGNAAVLSQVDRRSREQPGETARQVAALSSRIDGVSAELSRLSGRLDEVSRRLEDLHRQAMEGSPPPAGPRPMVTRVVPPPPPAPTKPPSPAAAVRQPPATPPVQSQREPVASNPAVATTVSSPEETYQAAYLDYSRGQYALAIPAFREFLRRFPDSPLADSAQYSIGECYFSLARARSTGGKTDAAKQEMEQAVQEFRKVVINYPRGSKVPTALYKEAVALAELKQTALAQSRLQYLLEHFPQSEEAPLAKERLAALSP